MIDGRTIGLVDEREREGLVRVRVRELEQLEQHTNKGWDLGRGHN